MMPFHPVKPIRGGKPLDAFYHKLAADPSYMCQAKLDGQRTLWDPKTKTLWSRRGLRINKVPEIAEALAGIDVTLDGELVLGACNRYFIFDLPDHKGALEERWECLSSIHKSLDESTKQVVNLCPCDVRWDHVESEGWEGVVFKKRSSSYVKSGKPDLTTAHWIKYRLEWM